jgi:hypothetical protein
MDLITPRQGIPPRRPPRKRPPPFRLSPGNFRTILIVGPGFVKETLQKCRCSMIMSVVNWSVKMSVWGDERETDIESGRAEAVVGNE